MAATNWGIYAQSCVDVRVNYTVRQPNPPAGSDAPVIGRSLSNVRQPIYNARRRSMPELPEVEVVRRGLDATVAQRTLVALRVFERRLRWPIAVGIEDELKQQRLLAIGRRGKYLLLQFAHGTLISHLGMSGSWRFVTSNEPRRLHDHIDLVFEHGALRYHDPRRFGSLHWQPGGIEQALAHPLLAKLGVEPFSDRFNGQLLFRQTRGRGAAIKQVLLAGQIVVGVGNIYASETLFRAGIRPTLAAGRRTCRRRDIAIFLHGGVVRRVAGVVPADRDVARDRIARDPWQELASDRNRGVVIDAGR